MLVFLSMGKEMLRRLIRIHMERNYCSKLKAMEYLLKCEEQRGRSSRHDFYAFFLNFRKHQRESVRQGILSIWDNANIIKISEEEIVFDKMEKIPMMRMLSVNYTIKTSNCYTKEFSGKVKGLELDPVDTKLPKPLKVQCYFLRHHQLSRKKKDNLIPLNLMLW